MTTPNIAEQLARALKPCPFCGRADSTHTDDCYFTVEEKGGDVFAAWNRRAAWKAGQTQDEPAQPIASPAQEQEVGGRVLGWHLDGAMHVFDVQCYSAGAPPQKFVRFDDYLAATKISEQALRELAEHGLRCDMNPTHDMSDMDASEAFWHRYLKLADDRVRKIAAAALNTIASPAQEPQAGQIPTWAWREAMQEWCNVTELDAETNKEFDWIERRARELAAQPPQSEKAQEEK